MKPLSIAHAILGALNLGAAYAHVLELVPKRRMSGSDWLTTQQAYSQFGKVAGALIPTSSVLSVARAVASRRTPARATLFGTHAALSLATVAVWAFANRPVNHEILYWDRERLPENWEDRRDRWDVGHAVSAGLHVLGFAALIAAITFDEQ